MKYVLFIQIRFQIECECKRVKENRERKKKVHKIFSMLLLKLPYRSLYPLLPSNCNSLTDVVSALFLWLCLPFHSLSSPFLCVCACVLFFFSSFTCIRILLAQRIRSIYYVLPRPPSVAAVCLPFEICKLCDWVNINF